MEQASELSLVTQAGVWKSQGQYLTRYGVDIPAGRDLLRRAAEVGEEVGDFDLRYGSLVSLAEIDLVTGDAAQALAWSEEVVAFVTRLGHAWMMPEAERRMAHALLATGSIAGAATHAEHALEIVVADDVLGTASARLALATVRDAQGREAEAARALRPGCRGHRDDAPSRPIGPPSSWPTAPSTWAMAAPPRARPWSARRGNGTRPSLGPRPRSCPTSTGRDRRPIPRRLALTGYRGSGSTEHPGAPEFRLPQALDTPPPTATGSDAPVTRPMTTPIPVATSTSRATNSGG